MRPVLSKEPRMDQQGNYIPDPYHMPTIYTGHPMGLQGNPNIQPTYQHPSPVTYSPQSTWPHPNPAGYLPQMQSPNPSNVPMESYGQYNFQAIPLSQPNEQLHNNGTNFHTSMGPASGVGSLQSFPLPQHHPAPPQPWALPIGGTHGHHTATAVHLAMNRGGNTVGVHPQLPPLQNLSPQQFSSIATTQAITIPSSPIPMSQPSRKRPHGESDEGLAFALEVQGQRTNVTPTRSALGNQPNSRSLPNIRPASSTRPTVFKVKPNSVSPITTVVNRVPMSSNFPTAYQVPGHSVSKVPIFRPSSSSGNSLDFLKRKQVAVPVQVTKAKPRKRRAVAAVTTPTTVATHPSPSAVLTTTPVRRKPGSSSRHIQPHPTPPSSLSTGTPVESSPAATTPVTPTNSKDKPGKFSHGLENARPQQVLSTVNDAKGKGSTKQSMDASDTLLTCPLIKIHSSLPCRSETNSPPSIASLLSPKSSSACDQLNPQWTVDFSQISPKRSSSPTLSVSNPVILQRYQAEYKPGKLYHFTEAPMAPPPLPSFFIDAHRDKEQTGLPHPQKRTNMDTTANVQGIIQFLEHSVDLFSSLNLGQA
ncbi:hypothetical protein IWQ62_002285 [Dispira parvispora]|uniref:Uncharacterized protein n=1 Tax=Dispira parvispora TaxID=1520584 RepID=A0A9W8AQN1_9FUNG|nr:hypothetical protein IWQ62_002285 [Dispira parvispora]